MVRRHRFGRMAVPVAGLAVAGLALSRPLRRRRPPGSLSGTLYVDPSTQSARWAPRAPTTTGTVIRDRIASKVQSCWVSEYNPSTVQSTVSSYVTAASSAGQVPVITAYMIPNWDCGGASAVVPPSQRLRDVGESTAGTSSSW